MTKKIVVTIGTRPDVIKMAPVIKELKRVGNFDITVLSTNQHNEMLQQAMATFSIEPDISLSVFEHNQTPLDVAALTMSMAATYLEEISPDLVLVQGDTTSAVAVAYAAKYTGVSIGHVEAGLRTNDFENPWPEELNRVMIDAISDYFFAPSRTAVKALLREGVASEKILYSGNTVIDALVSVYPQVLKRKQEIVTEKNIILVTMHRRESFGAPVLNLILALQILAQRNDVHIVFPVHKNPNIHDVVHKRLSDRDNITLLEPVDYITFLSHLRNAVLVITDSGGVLEEASYIMTPALIIRDKTERMEVVDEGVAKLIGTQPATILDEVENLLDDKKALDEMVKFVTPYGDGNAAKRIVSWIKQEL